MVLSRVQKLKRRLKVDTQKLRGKTLEALEELFDIAKELAKNEDLPLNVRRNRAGSNVVRVDFGAEGLRHGTCF